MSLRWRLSVCIALSTLIRVAAQAPPPVLNYTSPPNFLKLSGTNPEDFTANDVNAGIQIYPFRPIAGNLQVEWQRTLLREWIDPRYRESNVAGPPAFSNNSMPGAQAVLVARFIESIAGFPREHLRTVIVAGGSAAIVDISGAGGPSWQRITPAVGALFSSMSIGAASVAPPPLPPPAGSGRTHAGIFMGIKQRFKVNPFGPVGTGTFTPSPHFYIFAPDGRVYRTFDVLNVPQSDPSRFDFATAARIDPDNSGQFAVQGGFLIMRFGGAQPESLQVPLSPDGSFIVNSVTYTRQ
jgi:hypothetical protein